MGQVVFRGGQLLCGVLDKSQFGASQFGFVHSCQELYGGGVANQLLSALGCLFTTFLQLHGFTLGVEDILVTPEVGVATLCVLCIVGVCVFVCRQTRRGRNTSRICEVVASQRLLMPSLLLPMLTLKK